VADFVDQFAAFAIDGTGSVMAFWTYNDKIKLDQAPIVYLDSEGGGIVVASSVTEFLSLLPFNTSIFSEVGIHWTSYKSHPEYIISPEAKYTPDYYNSRFEIIVKNIEAYTSFPLHY